MSKALLDEELLLGYLNNLGKDIVRQMIDLYTQQSKIYLDDINLAIAEQSTPLWHEHCHKMKGAAGSVGLKALHSYLVKIEKADVLSEEKLLMLRELIKLNNSGIAAFISWLNAA